MAKPVGSKALPRLTVAKRTSIGSGKPLNKSKRRSWKAYRGQGRP
jgi:hypothetical protein